MFQTIRNLMLLLLVGVAAATGLKFVAHQPGGLNDDPAIVERGLPDSGRQAQQANSGFSRQMVLNPGRGGQYWVTAEIDGVAVRFLVDTGASHVVLSPRDGERLGLDDGLLEYSQVFQTASGYTRAAPVVLDDVRIGQLQLDGIEAAVNQSQMGASLLGMTFLRELDGFQVEDGKLIFYW